ncbi:MAG: hypothetical protein SFV51_25100 [Bryobacteraceae bacterium]|nr:hypothetical protein [Bryobacteraceae bacterium]
MNRIMHHIARGTTASPLSSMSRSFGVAAGYALAGQVLPTVINPAYVYEIEIEENDGYGTRLIHPVVEIARNLGSPYDLRSYQHDGDGAYLLGVADPVGHPTELSIRSAGTRRHPDPTASYRT